LFFDSIRDLIVDNKNYHHIFAGTSRCLDNLIVYINKYPFLKNKIHFVGEIKNIYCLLKNIDFFINSFPTSGGSDIEAAYVGKPSIEFIHNRNLTLHPTEFLSSIECIVTNKFEFKKIATKLISNQDYRNDLGNYLKTRVTREYNKDIIVKENILDTFIEKYNKKLEDKKINNISSFSECIDYEKNIAFFNSYVRYHFKKEKKYSFLNHLINKYPNNPFAWIKLFEETIINMDLKLFNFLLNNLSKEFKYDGRILLMISLNYYFFSDYKKSLEFLKKSKIMLGNTEVLEVINILEKQFLNIIEENDDINIANNNKVYKDICSYLPIFYNY